MNRVRRLLTHPEFRQGGRDMLGITLGIGAWGLMTGVAMLQSGLSLLEALGMTLLVFAGSAQLAALPLMVAGAPMWVILATAFCVNLRFVVFSAHLRPFMMHLSRRERLITGYFTGDLSYVMFVRRFSRPGQTIDEQWTQDAYLAGMCFVNWASWVGAGLVGLALAHAIPLRWGLGFAGILALLGMLCSLATDRLRALSAAVAGAAAVAAYAMPLKLNILLAIAAAVAVGLTLEPRTAEADPP